MQATSGPDGKFPKKRVVARGSPAGAGQLEAKMTTKPANLKPGKWQLWIRKVTELGAD